MRGVTTTWGAKATRRIRWTTGIVDGLLDLTPEIAPNFFGDVREFPRRFVAIDEKVWKHYGERILALLARYGIEHNDPLIMPGGEKAKTMQAVAELRTAMHDFGVPRFAAPPQGWGGGVLHDLLGLAAGEYRRGVEFEFIATTVLCGGDAMMALKNAADELYKNRIGLYHPAKRSWTDLAFYGTLSDHDIREGMAEIIKWAVAGDSQLFALLEAHAGRIAAEKFQGGDRVTRTVVARTIRGMLNELTRNPFEQRRSGKTKGVARRSYIGHGISPGFEPTLTHGEAVALDILLTSMAAWRLGLITQLQRDRIMRVFESVGLRLWHPILDDTARMMLALRDTANHRGGRQLIPAPHGVAFRRLERPIGKRIAYLELSEAQLIHARDDLHGLAT